MFLFPDSKWIIVVSFVLGMFWPYYASLILHCPVNLGSIRLGDSIKIIDKASLVAAEKWLSVECYFKRFVQFFVESFWFSSDLWTGTEWTGAPVSGRTRLHK